ncbi:GNAT family N-acetyltransferase [Streptomyces sp. NPDC059168]|uniref:GNAT family N-acetyltransferase n=1 Tax=Streptomyces sp. NPDC059168 TaxID=3346753 RepID=UPI0036857992
MPPGDPAGTAGSRPAVARSGGASGNGVRTLAARTPAESPGAAFLRSHGFGGVLTLRFARLPLAAVDTTVLGELLAAPHPGYRLESWTGTVPDHLAETFASSRRAMDDMPMEDMEQEPVAWDVERVRAVARAVEKRGDLLYTVAALDEADGAVAGFTELVVPGSGTGDAQHYGTGVLPRHRGAGLARWMKAESIRQARERHPGLRGLLTDTAVSNTPMRRVNDQLGYERTHEEIHWSLRL